MGPHCPCGERSLEIGYCLAKSFGGGVKFSLWQVVCKCQLSKTKSAAFETYLLKIGKKVIPCPSRIPQFFPPIIVTLWTAIEKHTIMDWSTTNYFGCVNWTGTVIQSWLRNACVCDRILWWCRESWYQYTWLLIVTTFWISDGDQYLYPKVVRTEVLLQLQEQLLFKVRESSIEVS